MRKKYGCYSSCMAINIKDPETDRLVRELATRMGVSITEAIKVAVQDQLSRTRPRADVVFSEIQAIIDRGRTRPMLNDLTEDEILGYDEFGIPS